MLEETEHQIYALSKSLHQLQISPTLELKRLRDHYLQELADNLDRLPQCCDQHTREMEAKLIGATTSYEILKAKFQQDVAKAKEELDTLHAKYEMDET